MKIIHVAETIKGGVGTVLNSLTTSQRISDYEVKALIPKEHEFIMVGNKEAVITYDRKNRGIRSLFNLSKSIFTAVRKNKPMLVHLHSSYAGLVGRITLFLMGYNGNIVYCPHAFSFLMVTSKIKRKIYELIELVLSIITKKIICVSEYEFNAAIKIGISNKKLVLIHNGTPIVKSTDKIFKKNNIYKLLYVGRLDYQKGFDIFINELSKLSELDYEIEVDVIGESVTSKSMHKALSNKSIQINYRGWLNSDDLRDYYNNADIVIIPSRWEGFAMVPLEAMSYGTPIILSSIEPFKELKKYYSGAIIFDLENTSELSSILKNLDSYNLPLLGEEAKKCHKINFSLDGMNNNYVDMYNEMNNGH